MWKINRKIFLFEYDLLILQSKKEGISYAKTK